MWTEAVLQMWTLAGECPACWGMLYPIDPSQSFGAAHANAQPGAQKEMGEL